LENTESDRIPHEHRQVLTSAVGFNEKAFDILGTNTYLTIGDVKELIKDVESVNDIKVSIDKNFVYQNKILDALKALYSKNKNVEVSETVTEVNNSTNTTNTTKTNLNPNIKSNSKFNVIRGNRQVLKTYNYLAMTKVVSRLKIKNLLPDFQCHIKLHLCKLKDPYVNGLENLTPDSIPSMIIRDLPEKAISESSSVFSTGYDFKTTLRSHLNLDLTSSDNFKKHVQISKTFCRTLTEGSQFYFDLYEYLGDGICLEDLFRNSTNNAKIQSKIPVGHFLIIEYFGDPRATITRKADGDIFNGYSPVKINYRFELSVSYIVNQNRLDYPVVLKKSRTGTSFVDQELGDIFYPTRQPSFHVNFNNIDILTTSKKNEYTLNLAEDLENKTLVNKVVDSLSGLGVGVTDLKNITEDDINMLRLGTKEVRQIIDPTDNDDNDDEVIDLDEPGSLRGKIKP